MARLLGAVLTTVSAVLFLVVFLADLFGLHTNPYLGAVFFLILPATFLLGLALVALGSWPATWPRIDLNDPAQRTTVIAVSALTIANVVIVSMAAYRGVEYMDSVTFCGQVCHTVMQPEFVAHQRGAHANVKCVDCHVSPGASGFVSAKTAGTRRVLAVIRGTYPTPIVPEPRQLATAAETCEQCHSPRMPHGDTVRRIADYSDNEQNVESITTLKMHVDVIHRHVSSDIEFIATDKTRQTIPYVRVKSADGSMREFVTAGVTADRLPSGERRRMDCMDCHNRPSHGVATTPERAVNDALASDRISRTLPFVHREAVKALVAGNSAAVRDFYRTQQPQVFASRASDIERAVAAVQDIHERNVFAAMKVTFGSYPNNIGHVDSPGCFRCHDDDHVAKDGKKIGQDCETCHGVE